MEVTVPITPRRTRALRPLLPPGPGGVGNVSSRGDRYGRHRLCSTRILIALRWDCHQSKRQLAGTFHATRKRWLSGRRGDACHRPVRSMHRSCCQIPNALCFANPSAKWPLTSERIAPALQEAPAPPPAPRARQANQFSFPSYRQSLTTTPPALFGKLATARLSPPPR